MTALIGHAALESALDWPALIAELRAWYRADTVEAPERQVLSIQQPDGSEGSLLIMPAWVPGQNIGVKVVTFFPQNADQGRPTINAGYLLFDGATGQMQAALDGDTLTARRTPAASALAADYLARADASRLLVVGTGQLAVSSAAAHCAVRSYRDVTIWGRTPAKAANIAATLRDLGINATVSDDLEAACGAADVITTLTAATQPIIFGDWLRPGTHLDLVGAFKADMRESDDRAIMQAEVFVDHRKGAMLAGDLAQPLDSGSITDSHILADLSQLCQGAHPGRQSDDAFTVFKSAGMALQDLAAATLAADQLISG
ncbi:ornithine cyclodeaminase family protein [Marinovum sp. 2_MG-2023]|uniref:ornithine cyclodeaminase family protein n=1 Tax=unclassified Marinovum TaxID=2647166 RepID=UPI0026E28920|nr:MULTISPECIES: ornithine cyclodeaminase family protein [unclassified Marinovum]MDO6728798.1 ornithine cyclodeaminase family protein [Marinovum sp. 2_MG-2023]MDO6777786.1 ornithine cyclodeaminase family protein [Marinovum sp. 1_MG-2023]